MTAGLNNKCQSRIIPIYISLWLICICFESYGFAETKQEAYTKLRKMFPESSDIFVPNWNEKNGLPNGLVTGYYNKEPFKGKKAIEINFSDGYQDGITKIYDLEGGVVTTISYSKGKEHGVTRWYDKMRTKPDAVRRGRVRKEGEDECRGKEEARVRPASIIGSSGA